MNSNFQVKITADLGDLAAKIKNIEATLKKLDTSFRTVSGRATSSLQSTGQAAATAGLDMNRMRLASFALGQVLRDSGFFAQSFGMGLLAISNNIPILIDQLVMLSNISKGLGAAISLMGSVLTAVITVFAYSAMSADKYNDSLDKIRATAGSNVITLNALLSIAKDETLSYSARQEAINKLNQDYEIFNENLSIQNVNSKETQTAVNALTQSIYLQAEAQVLQNEIQDEIAKRRKLEGTDLKDQAGLYDKFIGKVRQFNSALGTIRETMMFGGFAAIGGKMAKGQQEYNKAISESGLKNFNTDMQISDDKINKLTQDTKKNLTELAKIGQLDKKDKGKEKESEEAKRINRISDAYKELNNTLAFLSADPTITQLERLRKSSEAYKSLLETLFKEGFKESSKNVQDVIYQLKIFGYEIEGIIKTTEGLEKSNDLLKSVTDIFAKLADSKIDINTGSFTKNSQRLNKEIELVSDAINKLQKLDAEFPGLLNISPAIAKLKTELTGLRQDFVTATDLEKEQENLKKFQEDFKNFALNFEAQVINFLSSAVSDFAFAIGEMFVTGNMDFGAALLTSVADFLKSLGAQMVQFGMMAVLFGKLQLALMFGDPATKIGAGLALIGVGIAMSIAAGAISAGLKKGKDNKSGGKPFANGGIVSGPTNALIGEYPGAKSNPEVVAPLNKLKSLISDTGNGGNMIGQLEARISGNDLVILMNRASKNRNGYF